MDQWGQRVKNCKEIPETCRFEPSEKIVVEEIGDGNLNVVLRVIGASGRSIIVKHSLPYIKCLGEGFPLGEQRIDIEYKALHKFHTLSPGSVPEVFVFDKPNNAMYMEDLKGYKILRLHLMAGEFDLSLAEKLGYHLANVHRDTHVGTLSEDQIKSLDADLSNSMMSALTQDFVFRHPFTQNESTNRSSPEVSERLESLYGDENVLTAAKNMLELFSNKKECLIHGDLHTGSIMVSGTNLRIIDIEFASVGAAGYDLGVVVANFLFSYFRHMSIEEDYESHRNFAQMMIDACKQFVNTYLQHMTAFVGEREAYVQNLMSETAGFAGCEIVRRLVGTAHNADVEGLPHAEVDCYGAGIRLLQGYKKINSIDKMLLIALMLA